MPKQQANNNKGEQQEERLLAGSQHTGRTHVCSGQWVASSGCWAKGGVGGGEEEGEEEEEKSNSANPVEPCHPLHHAPISTASTHHAGFTRTVDDWMCFRFVFFFLFLPFLLCRLVASQATTTAPDPNPRAVCRVACVEDIVVEARLRCVCRLGCSPPASPPPPTAHGCNVPDGRVLSTPPTSTPPPQSLLTHLHPNPHLQSVAFRPQFLLAMAVPPARKRLHSVRQFGHAVADWWDDTRVRSRDTWAETKTLANTHVRTAPRNFGRWCRDSFLFYRNDFTSLRLEIVSGFTIAILQIPERCVGGVRFNKQPLSTNKCFDLSVSGLTHISVPCLLCLMHVSCLNCSVSRASHVVSMSHVCSVSHLMSLCFCVPSRVFSFSLCLSSHSSLSLSLSLIWLTSHLTSLSALCLN